jgi:hypothetical protein
MFLAPFLVIPQPSLNNTGSGSEWGILHAWESLSDFASFSHAADTILTSSPHYDSTTHN